jgi:hypothetical protein
MVHAKAVGEVRLQEVSTAGGTRRARNFALRNWFPSAHTRNFSARSILDTCLQAELDPQCVRYKL